MDNKVKLIMPLLFISTISLGQSKHVQVINRKPLINRAHVSFDDYEMLVDEVKEIRAKRLIDFDQFLEFQKDNKTVVLDTRSKDMFNMKHIKGAINLPFTEFTQDNLRELIPDVNTRILIYCNNNFGGQPFAFASKSYTPDLNKLNSKKQKKNKKKNKMKEDELSHTPMMLALNIPTYINLYGYGYRNIYELNEYLYKGDKRLLLKSKGLAKLKRE